MGTLFGSAMNLNSSNLLSQCIRQRRLWISSGLLYLLLTLVFAPVGQCMHLKDTKSISSSLQLQCPPCEQLFCTPKNPKRLKCKGGITTGICNCCPVCAKIEGESCGGEFDYLGKCDKGLYCDTSVSSNDVLHSEFQSKDGKIKSKPEGICKRSVTFHPGYVGDQPFPTSACKPQCTPEYCEKNPRAICSALNNADTTHTCQGDCQHTSCRACRFVYEGHPCGKCRKDDYRCIKKFGQCMRQHTCSRTGFPCKKAKTKNPLLENAEFKCMVPDCL